MTNQIHIDDFSAQYPCDPDWVVAMFDKPVKVFSIGQTVKVNGNAGTIQGHYHNGMWNVQLKSGEVCVSGPDIQA